MYFNPEGSARAGAAYLDDVSPGWSARVNTDKLDIEYDETCMLGQLCGSYGRAARILGLSERQVNRLGFFSSHPLSNVRSSRYHQLTAAWKKVIAERQAEVAELPLAA